jgi:hypothetical protein
MLTLTCTFQYLLSDWNSVYCMYSITGTILSQTLHAVELIVASNLNIYDY